MFWIITAKEIIKSNMLHQYDKIIENLLKQDIDPKPWMELNSSRLQHLGFSYSLRKVNKNILLFKARELSADFLAIQESTNYLRFHTTQSVEVCEVSGNHNTILQGQNVKKIAKSLMAVLNNIVIDNAT